LIRILATVLLFFLGVQTAQAEIPITLGRSDVALNGPWRFHTGDDARWKLQSFLDENWETVDLTPRAGAHDADVGLTNYVPGWSVRGHAGYKGCAGIASRSA
jgi:hypothetical protein